MTTEIGHHCCGALDDKHYTLVEETNVFHIGTIRVKEEEQRIKMGQICNLGPVRKISSIYLGPVCK